MKRFLLLGLLLSSLTIYSQKSFQGKAVYMAKTSMDMSRFGEMSEQRKKQIMARMKNFLERTYTLNFNQSSSTFKQDVKLDAPTNGGGRGFRFGGTGQSVTYKSVKDKQIIESTEFFGKKFLIKEEMTQPEWELSGETKKIGNYTCFKATLVKEDTSFDFRSLRRPRNNSGAKKDSMKVDNKPKKRTVVVTAWYTPQIPISAGPSEYWGLPGLILELSEGRTTMLCTEIVLNPVEKLEINEPTKGKEITRKEYNTLVKKKTEEMRERFSRGRGDGPRRRF